MVGARLEIPPLRADLFSTVAIVIMKRMPIGQGDLQSLEYSLDGGIGRAILTAESALGGW
ncbi:hypothetical protein D3C86_2258030 [compost metagenome]